MPTTRADGADRGRADRRSACAGRTSGRGVLPQRDQCRSRAQPACPSRTENRSVRHVLRRTRRPAMRRGRRQASRDALHPVRGSRCTSGTGCRVRARPMPAVPRSMSLAVAFPRGPAYDEHSSPYASDVSQRMFIDVPDESELGEEISAWYAMQRQSWGYLPNYASAFATRPDVAQAWTALSNAVGKGMERRRYELATIAAARALRSTYCMAAHCMVLRDD